MSTKKGSLLVSLPNLVTGGEQSSKSLTSLQRQDRPQSSEAGALSQQHSLCKTSAGPFSRLPEKVNRENEG